MGWTIWDLFSGEGDPFGHAYVKVFIDGQLDHVTNFDNGAIVDYVSYAPPRKIGPIPPSFFSDGAGFLRDPLDWAFGGGGQQAHVFNYDSLFYTGFVGAGIRSTLGDDYLAHAGGWELVEVTTSTVTASVLGGLAGGAAASSWGAGEFGSTVIGGAVGGGVDYAAQQGLARAGSALNNGGEVAPFSAIALAENAAAGAITAGLIHGAGGAFKSVVGKFAKPLVCDAPELGGCFLAGTPVMRYSSVNLKSTVIYAGIEPSAEGKKWLGALCAVKIAIAGWELMTRSESDQRKRRPKRWFDKAEEDTEPMEEELNDAAGDSFEESFIDDVEPERNEPEAALCALLTEAPATQLGCKRRTFRSRLQGLRSAWLAGWLAFAGMLAGGALFERQPAATVLPTTPTAVEPASSTTAIESIRVGDRVMGNRSAGEMSGATQVDPATWKKLRLGAISVWTDGTRDEVRIETLQPPEWLAAQHASVGARVPLPVDLVEMGLPADLQATVEAVDTCPVIQRGPGRVVLTTVSHLNSDVYQLTVAAADGHLEMIRPTGVHKFYRPRDNAFIPAKELQPGDELSGVSGLVVVRGVEKLPGVQRVYNMTVEGEHVYRVSLLGALVHNTCPWKVGPADELRAESVGDSLDVHHAVQAHPAEQIIPGYDRATGPAIAVPDTLHGRIPKLLGDYEGTARDLLARDIKALRGVGAPRDSLLELIDLNKQTYPGVFDK